uniref:Mitochondrial proton/calcium exchanger protein n=1 Tax=Tetraselmis sp. GSL018 TaxID=582737 RepID=A0A061S6J5_9CHLO|mmetsp:Transcript_11868/g.28183  ORF Transcript_11868/g.28183 Transcript_11868/m.28183 type:complete len:887 (+) Transcript_11868:89-2749(+)
MRNKENFSSLLRRIDSPQTWLWPPWSHLEARSWSWVRPGVPALTDCYAGSKLDRESFLGACERFSTEEIQGAWLHTYSTERPSLQLFPFAAGPAKYRAFTSASCAVKSAAPLGALIAARYSSSCSLNSNLLFHHGLNCIACPAGSQTGESKLQNHNPWANVHGKKLSSSSNGDHNREGHHQPANQEVKQDKDTQDKAVQAAVAAQREQDLEDMLFAELDRKRARNENVWHPPPGAAPTLRHRVIELSRGAASTLRWLVSALLYAPAAIVRFVAKGPSYWSSTLVSGWTHAKEELHHYWVGTKLLYVEVGVASELVWKLLQGKELSRREKAQLTRTTADIFRLVPMLVFVVVPFMEFLLPVALKLFPNMLPSTFEDKLKKEEQLRKRLALKLEVARFLQDTVAAMAKEIKQKNSGSNATTAAELYEFMGKVRAGEPVTNTEIARFAPLFNDELTLDNLERVQLQSMLTFVGLQPYGTDGFLKSRLRHHLAAIKEDDKAIRAEGVDSLTDTELREACRVRGMRSHFGEHARPLMKRNLEEWLELSMRRNMPTSLLLLSRAFVVTARTSKLMEEQLRDTLGSLPEDVVTDVGIQACASGETSKAAELEKKLALVQREKERIEEERLEAQLEEEAREAAEALVASEGKNAVREMSPEQQREIAVAAARAVVKEVTAGLNRQSPAEKEAWLAEKREKRMQEIISALAVLASTSGVSDERQDFMRIVRGQIKAIDEQIRERGGTSLLFTRGQIQASMPLPEDELITDVSDKVTSILKRMEKELDAADQQIKNKMKVLDEDGDGMITPLELSRALGFLHRQMGEDDLRALLEQLHCTKDGSIQVDELLRLAKHDVIEHERVKYNVNKALEDAKAAGELGQDPVDSGRGVNAST